MTYGVTSTGFVKKRFEDIQSDLQTKFRDVLGANVDTSPDSVLGQLIDVFAEKLAEQWEVAEGVYAAHDPDAAEDASLDNLCSYTGTQRDPATYSRVTATVNLDPGTYPAGALIAHVDGNPSALFANAEAVSNAALTADDVSAVFVATSTGPVAANAGTLTVISTPVAGWNSITNATDATLGAAIEGDESLRSKRVDELSAQGSTRTDAIRADILRLDGVIDAVVIENDTDTTDANGLPPHSIECIVYGPTAPTADDDQALVDQIWASKAAGIATYGTDSGIAEDAQGFDHAVGFSRTTFTEVYLEVQLYYVAETYAGDSAVQAAYATIGGLYGAAPGSTYVWNREISKGYGVDGVAAITSFGVSNVPGGPYTQTNVSAGIRGIVRVLAANVSVISAAVP